MTPKHPISDQLNSVFSSFQLHTFSEITCQQSSLAALLLIANHLSEIDDSLNSIAGSLSDISASIDQTQKIFTNE